MKRRPTTRNPSAGAPGQGGGELLARRLAPEQVHGVGSELPPVSVRASRAPVGLEQAGHLHAVFEPQPSGHAVGHVELGGHRRPRPHGVAHGSGHDLAGEAGAVLDAAPHWSRRRLSFGLKNALNR